MRLIISILLLAFFVACGKKSANNIDLQIEATDGIINDIINADANLYRYLTLDTFVWGADTASVAVVYKGDKVVRVAYLSEISPDNEWDFFLSPDDNKLVQFSELTMNMDKDCRYQNRFYYHDDKMIKGQASILECYNPEHKHNSDWSEYKSPDEKTDFRLNALFVDSLVKVIIKAVEADRPHLSVVANAARKKGAGYWATAENDEWTISMLPNNLLEFNLAGQVIAFNNAVMYPANSDDNDVVITAEKDGKQIEVLISLKTSECVINSQYVFSVLVKYDSIEYNGCGLCF